MSNIDQTVPAPTIDELTARACAIEGAWLAEQDLDEDLPEAGLVLDAWFRTEYFAAADISAQVEHAVLAEGAAGTAAIAVHVEVFDHDDVWTITLLFAQDATRAVLVGVPSEPLEMGPLEALLGTSQALPFSLYDDDFVLGHG
ncbi:hypothetical protein [Enhygromyxa salina]|uniref:Uncharacterized protein n=1 Tax=Enhygromyxa salina TaxID=215803 RepID=A0A2S9YS35_9BACT|nr:hypothetical protein [Enhygromyxa salina]PRQ07898.1 hypothetical protein ENSA7_23370 [Enhygromyxa salina]